MACVKNNLYRGIPFSTETVHDDFYISSDLKQLSLKCEMFQLDVVRCRTIGVLQSVHGKHFLTDLDSPAVTSSARPVRISVAHMRRPPPPAAVPYPAQVFGTLQWKNRPVIFATIIQMLTPATAVRLRRALNDVIDLHLANDTAAPSEIPDSQPD